MVGRKMVTSRRRPALPAPE